MAMTTGTIGAMQIGDAAQNQGGMAGMGVGLGAGVGMGQAMAEVLMPLRSRVRLTAVQSAGSVIRNSSAAAG